MDHNMIVQAFKIAAGFAAGSFVYLYLDAKGKEKAS